MVPSRLRHLCSSSIVAVRYWLMRAEIRRIYHPSMRGHLVKVQDIQHQRHQIRRVPSLEVGETSCFLAASRYVFRQ
ncbi:hypothetical protein C6341_g26886 [Phytophthora cactorum]|nr:hypothetical protein PC122_g24350 [Phytophthora cactorum]KAG3122633.1 hypothetical protein C6341_g26886 [Phytophthora cactorum]